MKNYSFPAVLSFDDDSISVNFPDLPGCFTYGYTPKDALNNAKECLSNYIHNLNKNHEIIPPPTNLNNFHLESNKELVLVEVKFLN